MGVARFRVITLQLLTVVAMLLVTLMSPSATLLARVGGHCCHLREEEDGEIVQNILWVAGFAAIAIAVVAIIRAFVIGEAENLPTSGG
ncbi:MAG TPA: hypothetical protein VFF32_04900 [Dermatophilaceae bacterium]|nr:hypothetical protein [Dermatophilaceae bacterium]